MSNRSDVIDKKLSPQEKRVIENHGKIVFYQDPKQLKDSSRIEKIYNTFKNAKSVVDIERARYFTEAFKESEGEPLILRWAKALYHIAEKIEIYIDPNQLIVGRAGREGKYGLIYPELDGCFLNTFTKQAKVREESPFDITEADIKIIEEEISPYWKGKTYYEELAQSLPEDILKLTFEPEDTFTSRFIVNETSSMRSALQWVHDYKKGIESGFEVIKKDAQERIKELDLSKEENKTEVLPYLQSIEIVSDAIILWADRHSKKAAELAEAESDSKRKRELLEISRICAKVPRYPAETFYEALQSQWLIQLFSRLEQKTGATISNGRMDQYLYPYYKKDVEDGRIHKEEVKELLQCMWLAMAQYVDLYVSPAGVKFNEGYAHWEAVTIGGIDENGKDGVNELTYIFLEDKREFPLNYPDLATRIHKNSPEKYLREIALTIKEGSGFPKLINDEEVIPLLISKGADSKNANDYAVSGCTEARMPNLDTYTSPCPYVNLGAAVELTLYNGRIPRCKEELLTIETGRVEDFTSWQELEAAFLEQEKFLVNKALEQQEYVNAVRAKHFASPLGSSLHKLCMKQCRDIHSTKIEGGIDLGYFDLIGFGSAADSLAAIKKNVFDKKFITIQELKHALEVNFEGEEVIRQRLTNSPKYGNDDGYVDEIAKEIDLVAVTATHENQKNTGIYLDVRYVPVTSHIPFGKVTGALPNGRRAGISLSDGSSASQGADYNGPTSILMSNHHTKNLNLNNRASRLLNIKLSPAIVEGEEGTQKIIAFIKSWCELKLWHLQFNIINQETLKKAKANPEDYRSLLVRVAGYSAYFVELTKELQDDIIRRTQHETL